MNENNEIGEDEQQICNLFFNNETLFCLSSNIDR